MSHMPAYAARAALLLLVSLGIGWGGTQLHAQQTSQTPFEAAQERILRATVFLMQADDSGGTLAMTCVGAGTFVSRDGLILTSAHSTLPSAACPGREIIVALNVRADEPPIPMYRAEVVQADAGLDLAVLRVNRELDGRRLQPGAVSFPFVNVADADLQRDETVALVGYPSFGNDAVSIVRTTVSSMVAEPRGGNSAWAKLSSTVPGEFSGGGAYNAQGLLVGVPTGAPAVARSGTSRADCVVIQDTNGDGQINTADQCVVAAGPVSALRPATVARPLLRAASLGLRVAHTLPSATLVSDARPRPQIERMFFAPSVNEANMPTTIVRGLPTGTNSLYLFFDYAHMTPETVYELRVTRDNIPDANYSLAPARWAGSERGLWFIGRTGQPWPNGNYVFTLFVDGMMTSTAELSIGGTPTSDPAISDLVFGLSDAAGNVIGNGYVLPRGTTASARFVFRNMTNGTSWTPVWSYEGTEFFRDPGVWNDGPNGVKTVSVIDPAGLQPGRYRLALYVDNRLAATADFTIAGVPSGAYPRVFSNARFVNAPTATAAASARASTTLQTTPAQLFLVFDWEQLAPGTPLTMRWSVDGELFHEETMAWSGGGTVGNGYTMSVAGDGAVRDGTYSTSLLIDNVLLAQASVSVGIGQLPIDRLAAASGVEMRGRIIDPATGEGVAGASFILISDAFTVEQFAWRQDQVVAVAITDRFGQFQLDTPLDRDLPYSAVITAQGYRPLTADGLIITADTPTPVELLIEMSRAGAP